MHEVEEIRSLFREDTFGCVGLTAYQHALACLCCSLSMLIWHRLPTFTFRDDLEKIDTDHRLLQRHRPLSRQGACGTRLARLRHCTLTLRCGDVDRGRARSIAPRS